MRHVLQGEHNEWCKVTVFEESLQAPVMIRIPGLTDGGIVTSKLTEFVDIYPTVVEAAGLGSSKGVKPVMTSRSSGRGHLRKANTTPCGM